MIWCEVICTLPRNGRDLQSGTPTKAYPVRAKGSHLPLIQALRALRIWGRSCKACFNPSKIARRGNLKASTQLQFRATAETCSRALSPEAGTVSRQEEVYPPIVSTAAANNISWICPLVWRSADNPKQMCAARKAWCGAAPPLPRNGRDLQSGARLSAFIRMRL